MSNKKVMLTVKMLAYNHENYIKQAIESVICQKTEYAYELLIGEDCSTDRTREIIREYEEKYPDIIRVIYQKTNQGCARNSYSLDMSARGKYIANCEGDDYWCDQYRIQKDIDFLEKNLNYVGVCHRCKIVDENGQEIPAESINDRSKFWEFDKEIYTIKDYQKWLTPGHGCAQTRRNVIKENDLDYTIVYKASNRVSDRTHLLIHIVEGDIYCMQDVVACYRYRTSSKQNNYMTIQKRENLRAEDFLMMKQLEKWAYKNKGINLDLRNIKKERFIGSVVVWMKNPTEENKKIVDDIISYSGEPFKYHMYFFRILIQKWFYWKIMRKDKLIKL